MDKSDGKHSSHLQAWLEKLGKDFSDLGNDEKNQTLDFIIESCESSQLFYLSEKLQVLLKRDFIAYLPRELAYTLLEYFDPDSLRNCCLVSKTWNEIISTCAKAWQRACRSIGVKKSVLFGFQDAVTCKKLYLATCARLKSLQMGRAFESKRLYGHTDRVMAVHYKDGILATGSDDHTLRLWNCITGKIQQVLYTHTVADIKLMTDHVVTASFDATAVIWKLKTGAAVRKYRGHVAAVFTVDYNEQLDILVTGSADSTVKVWTLWQHETPVLLRSLPQQRSAWIIQVNLYWNTHENHYHLLSRDNMSIEAWKMDKISHEILEVGDWKNPHDDLIAGLQLCGSKVTYATMDPFNICYTVERSLEDSSYVCKQKAQEVSRDLFVQSFLGGGDELEVFLFIDGDQPFVHVIERDNSEILAVIPFPLDYRASKRNSTYCLGERDWLNGFDGANDQGLVFATSLRDNTILLVQWRTLSHHKGAQLEAECLPSESVPTDELEHIDDSK